ncbi:MAG: HD domain-containing protein [Rhodospirillales bacterium]|nr:HD domain-containing protein [Rhodospirillales bacterium]
METVSFTRMADGMREDYELLAREERPYLDEVPQRVLSVLAMLGHATGGYQVSRLEHCLQTATRAERDGADEELIVAALLHDIGDVLSPYNHSEVAAAVLKPYVREEVHWIVQHHGVFQLYYYGHHYGLDRNVRDRYRDHKYYDACVAFCERWDQVAFDPDYRSLPLAHFEPMVRRLLGRKLNERE